MASNTASLDSICTCKTCNHSLARDCMGAGCNCCKGSSHSMVMDGIEGFAPYRPAKKRDALKSQAALALRGLFKFLSALYRFPATCISRLA